MRYAEKELQALQLVAGALRQFGVGRSGVGRIIVGCSFGKDSMVTLHLTRRLEPYIPVFAVFADTEFEDTRAFAKAVERAWGIQLAVTEFKQPTGVRDNPVQCCGTEKVEATKRALAGVDAWISGIRRTEGITRAAFEPWEERGGLVKVNPILDFTELDVWRYTAIHGLPVHPRYRMGFRSLGCAICSVPEGDESESERAGRWPGTARSGGECGIHTESLR